MKFAELGEIALAWYRSANPTPEQQDLAIERLAVCGSCEFRVPASAVAMQAKHGFLFLSCRPHQMAARVERDDLLEMLAAAVRCGMASPRW